MILNELKLYSKVKQPSQDDLVWRYMSFEKFVNLLYRRKIFFSRLDQFPDRNEGVLPQQNIKKIFEKMKSLPFTTTKEAKRLTKEKEKNINSYRAYTLANCWSKNNSESLALWKIYLGGAKTGVAIQTTYGKLVKSICSEEQKMLFGEVQYINELDIVQQQTVSLRKSPSYSYENEIRAIIFNQYSDDGLGKPLHERGLFVDVDLNELVDKIYLPPLSSPWFSDTVSDIIIKYDFNFDVTQSEIRENL